MTRAASLRRGWCPSVIEPMQTGDGLLVRLQPVAARLSSPQARAVASAARACGNGLLDLSGRGNLQVRGVRPDSHARLVEMFRHAGLVQDAGEPQGPRPCILSPLAGADPSDLIDAAELSEAIEADLARADDLARLPPKFAIVVDGGGRLCLDEVEADVRVVALGGREAPILAVGLGTSAGPVWAGICALQEGPRVLGRVASAFCLELRDGGTGRVRDLSPEARARLTAAALLAPGEAPPPRSPGPRIGAIPLARGVAVALGLSFGRLDADRLEALADAAERFGSGELRLSPWRSVVVPGVAETRLPMLLGWAESMGFIVAADDPRAAVSACAGAPACARATVETQADALKLAAVAGARLAQGSSVHLSGCLKGCARPLGADLTLVGRNGGYAVAVREPLAGDATLTIDQVLAGLRRLPDVPLASIAAADLRRAFSEEASR